jgi:2-polyprenyl-6-methoxyphenol hydroxylase-like FAD-dependent oxidoreductase
VVIIGAGPVGLMVAGELCLGGVMPIVLERLPAASEIPKGNGMVGHIVEVLDYRGLLEQFRADAAYCGPVPGFEFGPLHLDLASLGTSPLRVLAVPQRRIEQRLAERLHALGGSIRRGHELVALTPHDDQVILELTGPDGEGYQLQAAYVVGCDGARSAVRKLAGIGFPGLTFAEVSRIGRVRLPSSMIITGTGEIEVPGAGRLKTMRMVRTARGSYSIAPLTALDIEAEPGIYIVATTEEDPGADPGTAMTLAELQDSIDRVLGGRLPISEPQWLTRTVGNSRLADRYREGRVLLAGDAAHIFGIGGSLNVGLLDAVNLGWKLAADVQGRAPGGLLDTYHTERHAAGRRALMHTRSQRALRGEDEGTVAVRELLTELLAGPAALRHVAELLRGSDVRYDMPGATVPAHPLVGRLMPDIGLEHAGGRTRVAELTRAARPVLLDFTADRRAAMAAAAWEERITVLAASALITPAPAGAVLMRPDGWVAWAAGPAADSPVTGLGEALRTWCGAPGPVS